MQIVLVGLLMESQMHILVFDLLTGANPKNMEKLNSKRSISVISTSEIPTGDMVRSTKSEYPEAEHMIGLIKEFSKKHVLLNATELSEHFFGSNMQANFHCYRCCLSVWIYSN